MGVYLETVNIYDPFFRRLLDDRAILSQAVIMRLSTKRGVLWTDPEYGLCISDYLNMGLTQDALVRIPFEVQAQLELDERIQSVEVSPRISNPGTGKVRIILDLVITRKTGDVFPLSLSISDLTVELLTQGVA